MEYKCSVCHEAVDGDLLAYIGHTEKHIMDEIKAAHPEWVESDGICKQCEEYFKGQLKGKAEN